MCFQHKSRSATPDTFRDSAKTFSNIAKYASVSNCVFGQWLGCPAPTLASYVPLCSARCAKGEALRVLPARMVKMLQWRKLKTDCHNKRRLVSDPMTVLNYKIDRGHPVLNDGPFITLTKVFTA